MGLTRDNASGSGISTKPIGLQQRWSGIVTNATYLLYMVGGKAASRKGTTEHVRCIIVMLLQLWQSEVV